MDETPAQTGEVITFIYKAPMELGDYQLYFGQLHAHTNLSGRHRYGGAGL